MNTRRFIVALLTSVLFVTLFSLVVTQNALGQCAAGIAGCQPVPAGGERQKKPTQTLAPTPVPTATATLLPGAVVLPPPPALSGGVPSGPANPGNPNPIVPPSPGPLGVSFLTNPWGVIALVGMIMLVLIGGIYYFFQHRGGRHTLIGGGGGALGQLANGNELGSISDPFDKHLPGGGAQNFTVTRQDLGHDLQNVTITRQDLAGNTQNFTVNRQDLGNLENGTADLRDIGETGGTL